VPPSDLHIDHLNCGTMCPWSARLTNGEGGLFAAGRTVCHCLLIEGGDGLVLVDTGLGSGDIANPGQLGRWFTTLIRPQLEESETAVAQVRKLGFDPADVHHIIATHLDLDHAGGLSDFPVAKVHLLAPEHVAAMNPSGRERARYIPNHWAHGPRWLTHDTGAGGDEWLGFESVRVLYGSKTEILLIPLPGHSRGHTGVAIRRQDDWLLHCGDAFFFHGEVDTPPHCPPGLRLFQTLTQVDGKLRRQNQERLRELAQRHSGEVELICSHDPFTLDRLSAAQSLAT
jgi:glyoxylase-like metal-dependent hydrolase (beta-lactamase superfamily II)